MIRRAEPPEDLKRDQASDWIVGKDRRARNYGGGKHCKRRFDDDRRVNSGGGKRKGNLTSKPGMKPGQFLTRWSDADVAAFWLRAEITGLNPDDPAQPGDIHSHPRTSKG